MDQTFEGPWPELFGAASTTLRSVFLGEAAAPEDGHRRAGRHGRHGAAGRGRAGPAEGFFLLSLYADLDAVLPRLAAARGRGGADGGRGRPGAPGRGARPQRRAGGADGRPGAAQPGRACRTAADVTAGEAKGAARSPHWRVAIIGAGRRRARPGHPAGQVAAGATSSSSRRPTAWAGPGGPTPTPARRCDVPSHLYSYSFALKPDWTKTYAEQPEILQYFEDCADRFGIRPHLRPHTRITAARWDEGAPRWHLTDGEGGAYEADVLVSAIGTFTDPVVARHRRARVLRRPLLPLGALGARARPGRPAGGGHRDGGQRGADRARARQGRARRSTSTSAPRSGSCPARTSPSPRRRSAASPATRSPSAATAREIYWAFENTIAFRHGDETAEQLKALALSHIEYRIKDDELRAKLTPDYPFGCKRTLVCSDFYKALVRDNVELITERIEHVTPGRPSSPCDGRERPADAIVLATGFKATEYLEGIDVVGVGGRRLHDDWSEVAHAYLGLTVSGYPNFFMLYGPNTNQGGNSIIVILEAQAGYVLGALRAMRRRPGRAPSTSGATSWTRYNHELAEALAGTIWSDGCQSYFKNANGKIATQLPQTSRWYAERTRRFQMRGVCPLMKAAVYYETGAPDVFRYEDVPDPVPGPGDILVDVEAVSIEGGDTLNRLGGDLARVPHVVGYQCAGTVAEVGPTCAASRSGTAPSPSASTGRTPSAGPCPRPSPGRSPTACRPTRRPACRCPSGRPTTASSSSAACRRGRRR